MVTHEQEEKSMAYRALSHASRGDFLLEREKKKERERGRGVVKSFDRAGNYVSYRTDYLVVDGVKEVDDLELLKKIGEVFI